MDALQAAVLSARVPRLPERTEQRRLRAQRYRQGLAPLVERGLLWLQPSHAQHVVHQFVVRTPARDALRAALAFSDIATEVYYPEPLHLQPALAGLGYRPGSMPRAEAACRELLALPVSPQLSEEAQALIIDKIHAFFASVHG